MLESNIIILSKAIIGKKIKQLYHIHNRSYNFNLRIKSILKIQKRMLTVKAKQKMR